MAQGETHRIRPEALAILAKYKGRDVSESIALMEAKIQTQQEILNRALGGR